MKITLVHGTMRKSSTYTLAREALKSFPDAQVKEFFLPQALPHFCIGCTTCYIKDEKLCPHKEYTIPLWEALREADLLIFSSPVYVLRATGQMKAFLDHFGWAFMVHRPEPLMFSKAALVVSTGAGGGMKATIADITASLGMPGWGVGAVYTYAVSTHALHWNEVKESKKQENLAGVARVAEKIKKRLERGIEPSLKFKIFFKLGCFIQKRFAINPLDAAYWKAQGWLDGKNPWA